MSQRLDYKKASPEAHKAMTALYRYLPQSPVDEKLRHLVWLRISQINGCAYCVDLHWRDALKAGETPRRLNSVVTWRESGLFDEKEGAALAWAEALTLLVETGAPDDAYDAVRRHFDDRELADLSFLIALMNGLNRMGVGFRQAPPKEV